jgi:hypothetical protein
MNIRIDYHGSVDIDHVQLINTTIASYLFQLDTFQSNFSLKTIFINNLEQYDVGLLLVYANTFTSDI